MSAVPRALPDIGISIDSVSKTFGTNGTSVRALDRVSVQVPRGRFVSLIGPSGCGKSTLLRTVASLEPCTSGTVEVLGLSPRNATSHKLIGLVPQAPALLPWRTTLQNVRLPFEVNRRRPGLDESERLDPEQVLREVGLGDALDRKPAELSGGMQQRVAIARAFCFGAPVLLMDEPFSALDEFTREAVQAQLLGLWQRHTKTVLFVTHSVREAVLLSDTVVVMAARPGRITRVIDINLERPRDAAELERSSQFHDDVASVKEALHEGWA